MFTYNELLCIRSFLYLHISSLYFNHSHTYTHRRFIYVLRRAVKYYYIINIEFFNSYIVVNAACEL